MRIIASLILSLFASAAFAQSAPINPQSIPGCQYNATPLSLSDHGIAADQCDASGNAKVVVVPTTANALTPVVSASAEASHVLKSSAGVLWGVYATNLTATPGFLVVINATSAPGDGAITPLECVPLPAGGNASVSYNSGPSATFSTGITAVVSSATTCFTKTTGVITAFFKGAVQ